MEISTFIGANTSLIVFFITMFTLYTFWSDVVYISMIRKKAIVKALSIITHIALIFMLIVILCLIYWDVQSINNTSLNLFILFIVFHIIYISIIISKIYSRNSVLSIAFLKTAAPLIEVFVLFIYFIIYWYKNTDSNGFMNFDKCFSCRFKLTK
jgi:hypothetical protein